MIVLPFLLNFEPQSPWIKILAGSYIISDRVKITEYFLGFRGSVQVFGNFATRTSCWPVVQDIFITARKTLTPNSYLTFPAADPVYAIIFPPGETSSSKMVHGPDGEIQEENVTRTDLSDPHSKTQDVLVFGVERSENRLQTVGHKRDDGSFTPHPNRNSTCRRKWCFSGQENNAIKACFGANSKKVHSSASLGVLCWLY